MNNLRILALFAMFACPPFALADLPFDAGTLGRMQGILDSCRSASPREASDYLLQMKSLIGDATKAQVDEAARTDEYKSAYEVARSALSNLSQDERARVCSSYLATK